MLHRDYIFIKKIGSELKLGINFIENITLEQFLKDEQIKRAVCMTAINVGELVKGLTDVTTKKYSDIPWKKIAGFRDIAAHKYEALNMGDVYKVVKEDFYQLDKKITEIINNETDEKK